MKKHSTNVVAPVALDSILEQVNGGGAGENAVVGSAIGGMIVGAASGGQVGAVFGPAGILAGAVIGGTIGAVGGTLAGGQFLGLPKQTR
jgi:hypothetical protein